MNNAPNTTVSAVLGLMIVQLLLMVQAYREHKVHNIVLYPDKHSWCKTTTIKQVISYPGCTSIEIDNNVCVGACFSYSIPHTEPSDPGEVIVPYCDSCQPLDTSWHQITLQCNINDADTPSQLIKHVQIIHNCSCTSCEKKNVGLAQFSDNNEDFILQQSADDDLLVTLHSLHNESNLSSYEQLDRSKKMNSLLNQKLITLLQNIQVNNSNHDKEQLFELFNVMQDPMKQKMKAKNIIDFIDTIKSNKTDLNTALLTEILLKFEYPKHLKIDVPQIDASDVKEEEGSNEKVLFPSALEPFLSLPPPADATKADDATSGNDDLKSNRRPIAIWIQNPQSDDLATSKAKEILEDSIGSNSAEDDIPIDIEKDSDSTNGEILPQLTTSTKQNNIDIDDGSSINIEHNGTLPSLSLKMTSEHDQAPSSAGADTDAHTDTETAAASEPAPKHEVDSASLHQHLHHDHLHVHQHHVNDNVVASHGHLTRGPHGALVIEPDRIHKEKLDVNAHELKPNHAGTLLSYHSHSGEGNAR